MRPCAICGLETTVRRTQPPSKQNISAIRQSRPRYPYARRLHHVLGGRVASSHCQSLAAVLDRAEALWGALPCNKGGETMGALAGIKRRSLLTTSTERAFQFVFSCLYGAVV